MFNGDIFSPQVSQEVNVCVMELAVMESIQTWMNFFLAPSLLFWLLAVTGGFSTSVCGLAKQPHQAAPPCLLLLQLRPVYLPKATFTPPDKQKQQRQQLKWSTS